MRYKNRCSHLYKQNILLANFLLTDAAVYAVCDFFFRKHAPIFRMMRRL